MSERAPQGTACIAVRATGLTGTQNGGSLDDGAECSEDSMHREGSVHESRPEQRQTNCRNRVVPWVGFKDYIYFFKRRVRVGGSVVVVHTQKKTTWYSRVASGGTAIINNRNENVLLCTDCCTTNKSGAAGERRRTSKKVIHLSLIHI